jgi:hypothetical protein
MEVLALTIYGVWLFAAFGVRTVLEWRKTGDSDWRGLSGRFGSPEWLAGVLIVVARHQYIGPGASSPRTQGD